MGSTPELEGWNEEEEGGGGGWGGFGRSTQAVQQNIRLRVTSTNLYGTNICQLPWQNPSKGMMTKKYEVEILLSFFCSLGC